MVGKFAVVAVMVMVAANCIVASKPKCYQCSHVLEPCEVSAAAPIVCSEGSVCALHVKIGAPNSDKAIRKCVIPPKNGDSPCPDGFTCSTCTGDLCNAAPTGAASNFWLAALTTIVAYWFLH